MPQQLISTPWQRAYFQKCVIGGTASRGSYQRDDGCAGPSQRHDVEVVGEVELRTQKGSISGPGDEMKNRAEDEEEEVGSASSHLAGVTDLSQSGSARFPRCGVHWNNTYRIRGDETSQGCRFLIRRQEGFFFYYNFCIFPLPRDCVIEGIMN